MHLASRHMHPVGGDLCLSLAMNYRTSISLKTVLHRGVATRCLIVAASTSANHRGAVVSKHKNVVQRILVSHHQLRDRRLSP